MSGFSSNHYILNRIGVIRTPYKNKAPYQPVADKKETFRIVLHEKYTKGLQELISFKYIYVIYYLDKVQRSNRLTLSPPWANNKEIGVFASRSPDRPNPIGLSVVELLKIEENILYISGIDAFDHTPLLDIKPYVNQLDTKPDANYGWVHKMDEDEHLALHIKGLPHWKTKV